MNLIVTDRKILSMASKETSLEEITDLKLHEKVRVALASAWTKSPGLGLAAIQIGIPVCYGWYKLGNEKPVHLINPEIIKVERIVSFRGEGCLSIPDRWFQTWRYSKITYLNEVDGKTTPFTVEGLEAFVVQHEIDHMNGLLCECRTRKPEETGRNEPCPCGAVDKENQPMKFKKCCMVKTESDFIQPGKEK